MQNNANVGNLGVGGTFDQPSADNNFASKMNF